MTYRTAAARRHHRRLIVCLAQFLFFLLLAIVLLAVFDHSEDERLFAALGEPWVWVAVVPVLIWSLIWYLAVLVSGERVLFRDCDLAGYAEIKKHTGAPYAELPSVKWQSACLIDFYSGRFDRVLSIGAQLKSFYVRQNPEMLMMYAVAGYYGNQPEAVSEARAYFAQGAVAGKRKFAYRFADTVTEAVESLLAGRSGEARRQLEAIAVPKKLRVYDAVRNALIASACLAEGDADGANVGYAALCAYGDLYFAEKAKRILPNADS